jgi:hypothetical protein
VSTFKKKDGIIQLDVDGTSLTTPHKTANAFLENFQSVHSNHCHEVFPSINHFMDIVFPASISDFDVHNTTKYLWA